MAIFGDTNIRGSGSPIGGTIYGRFSTVGSETGTLQADSISIYLYLEEYGAGDAIKCALYDSSYNYIATTQQRTVLSIIGEFGTGEDWYTFTFSSPPTITASTQYIICLWASNNGDTTVFYRVTAAGSSKTFYKLTAYNGWPDPIDSSSEDSSSEMSIFCTYSQVVTAVSESDANRTRAIYLDSTKNIGSDLDKAKSQYLKTWDFTTTDKKPAVRHKTKDFGS